MSISNENLAKSIDEQLKAEGLISVTEKKLAAKLASGQMKSSDWKVALEEIINAPENTSANKNETK